MDFKKVSLYVALIVVGLMLWNSWQREFPPQLPASVPAQVAVPTTTGSNNVPTVLSHKIQQHQLRILPVVCLVNTANSLPSIRVF